MASVDVLLLNLPIISWYREKMVEKNSMPPLGILYIATYLKKHNYSVKVIDLAVESLTVEKFERILTELKPKIVGMSTYNETWIAQKMLCEFVKNILPDTIISVGGAFATFCYKDVLNETLTDYVIRGEGEESFLKLCEYIMGNLQEKSILSSFGICYKDEDGNIVLDNGRRRIIDLNNIPFPERDLVDMKKYVMPYTISTSRGCPGDCIFCSSKAFWGKKAILRSAENVFQEVMFLYEQYGTNIFSIVDDTFTASRKRCFEFCKRVKGSGISFLWECESRADVVDEELIKELYESGCHKIQFGFESADNEVLRKIKKKLTIEQIENAIMLASKYGMYIQASYIVGHAFDTEETINKTINFAKYLKDTYGVRVVCSVNTPFPGTEQYDKREELGINIKTYSWEQYMLSNPIISTKNLNTSQLRYYLSKAQKYM